MNCPKCAGYVVKEWDVDYDKNSMQTLRCVHCGWIDYPDLPVPENISRNAYQRRKRAGGSVRCI